MITQGKGAPIGEYVASVVLERDPTTTLIPLDLRVDIMKMSDGKLIDPTKNGIVDSNARVPIPFPEQGFGSLPITLVEYPSLEFAIEPPSTKSELFPNIPKSFGDAVPVEVKIRFLVNDKIDKNSPVEATEYKEGVLTKAIVITAPAGVMLHHKVVSDSYVTNFVLDNKPEMRVLPGDYSMLITMKPEGEYLQPGLHEFTIKALIPPSSTGGRYSNWFISLCNDIACRSPVDGRDKILAALGPYIPSFFTLF